MFPSHANSKRSHSESATIDQDHEHIMNLSSHLSCGQKGELHEDVMSLVTELKRLENVEHNDIKCLLETLNDRRTAEHNAIRCLVDDLVTNHSSTQNPEEPSRADDWANIVNEIMGQHNDDPSVAEIVASKECNNGMESDTEGANTDFDMEQTTLKTAHPAPQLSLQEDVIEDGHEAVMVDNQPNVTDAETVKTFRYWCLFFYHQIVPNYFNIPIIVLSY